MANLAYQAERHIICAPSGCGKTTLGRTIVDTHLHEYTRIAVFDSQEELCHFWNAEIQPATNISDFELHYRDYKFALYNPRLEGRLLQDEFSYFVEAVNILTHAHPGRKMIFIDELDNYQSPSLVDVPLLNLVQGSRRHEVDTLFIVHQPNRLNNQIRSQMNHIYAFRQNDTTTAGPLIEWGFDFDQLQSMAQFEFAYKNNRTGEIFYNRKLRL